MAYNYHQGGGGPYPHSSNNYSSSFTHDPYQQQEWGSYPTRDDGGALYPPHQRLNSNSTDSLNDNAPLSSYGAPAAGYSGGGGGGYGSGEVYREKDNPYAKGAGKKSRAMPWIIGGVVLLILIGAGVGIGVWRANANKNNSSSSSNSNSTTSTKGLQYIDGTAKVVKSNPSDPSDFEKDSRFHQVFYGQTYTPYLAQEPWCGATLANVTEDIQILSQLTTRLRMYGSACNISQLVLDAIDRTKVNMTVYLGSYLGDNSTVNTEQLQWQIDALKLFGTDHVSGIVVGNEYILNAADKATAISFITSEVATFKTQMAAAGFGSVPIGTGDAGSEITATLCEGVDFIMANDHAFFGGVPIDQAAGWTWDFFETNDQNLATAANIPAYIGETGWPTDSMTAANLTYGAATAGVSELQTFLDTYVCTANTNGTGYFWFSPFDEHWKEQYGGVEPYWGIFSQDKVLKDVTLPTCTSS